MLLHLRNHFLAGVRDASSLHHLLLLSTTAATPSRFVAADFLVTHCGLTPAQATKASKHIEHLKSPAKPEAVLAFLADIGLAKAGVATAIARDPLLLCSKVDKTLTPRIAQLRDLGLSLPQISSLISIAPRILRNPCMTHLQFYLSILGSCDKVCTVLGRNWGGRLLNQDVERVIKPNIAFLQQCGLTDCEISKLLMLAPIVALDPERAREIVECADKVRVPRDSVMFKYALHAIYLISPARIDAKLDLLKKIFGCSEAELSNAVCKLPSILALSEVNLSATVEFLKMEVGLEAEYIAKGLVKKDIDFFGVACLTEKKFTERFLDYYKEIVPGLARAYADAREAGSSAPPGILLPELHWAVMLKPNRARKAQYVKLGSVLTVEAQRRRPPHAAMLLHLRNHFLAGVRAATSLHHLLLLSTTAATASRFAAADFLVTRCGLTPAQASKASKHIEHLKTPAKPEAILAFLADIGLAKADIAAAIAREPLLLCSKVDKTLTPRITQLRDLGLSLPQISSLISIAPRILRYPYMTHLQFYLSILGSCDKVCTVLGRNWGGRLLNQDVELVLKPNIAFLQQCGLTDCEIAKLLMLAPIVALKPELAREIVECADKLRVPRHSTMFKCALHAIYLISPTRIDAKLDLLKKVIGCSEAELSSAVCKLPYILTLTEANLSPTVEFLKMEVGLEAEYIMRRPQLLCYSTRRRLVPRYYALKALKAKGLVKKGIGFYSAVSLTEKRFTERFLDSYKETVPGLAKAYAAVREAGVRTMEENSIENSCRLYCFLDVGLRRHPH
ncbi:hypothetical protein EJB05_20051, partial [Eragrostis curvula]